MEVRRTDKVAEGELHSLETPGESRALAVREVLEDPTVMGERYVDSLLGMVRDILEERISASELIALFDAGAAWQRSEEMVGQNLDPRYSAILEGQSWLRLHGHPLALAHGHGAIPCDSRINPAAFSELSYFTQSPVSYRLRLVGEALAALLVRLPPWDQASACLAALGRALRNPEEQQGRCESAAAALAIVAGAEAGPADTRSAALGELRSALSSTNPTCRHYAAETLALLGDTARDSRAPKELEELRPLFAQLAAREQCSILVFHNLREAIGDEWIRNGALLAALLELSPSAQATIITARPFLYNHQRVRAIHIDSVDSSVSGRFDLIFEQSYSQGELRPGLTLAASTREGAKMIFSSACSSNFYEAAPLTCAPRGAAQAILPPSCVTANVYARMECFLAGLGLHSGFGGTRELLGGNLPHSDLAAEVLAQRASIGAREIVLFNPFGGTFEEKGFLGSETPELLRELRRLIAGGALVVLFPSDAPWASAERLSEIRAGLSPAELRQVFSGQPAGSGDPRSHLALLTVADRVLSVEGGLTHLAMSTGMPVEILRRKGSGPTLMWLPVTRAAGQFQRTLHDELGYREKEEARRALADAVARFSQRHGNVVTSGTDKLLRYLIDAERLSPAIEAAVGASQEILDAAVRSFASALPGAAVLECHRAKWNLAERRTALREFCSIDPESPKNLELVGVADLNSGRAKHAGHFVYRLDLELDGEPRSVYCKGHPRADRCPVRAFPGWERRPLFHLYESVFWRACRLTGLADRRSGFFADPRDGDCIGYTLTEEIPGQSSAQLIVDGAHGPHFRPELERFVPSIATQLGRWCALMELLRGGDRRIANLGSAYERPSNYLVAFTAGGPLVTGIDHELLFCKEPCVTYDRSHGANESHLLRAVPEHARAEFQRAFSTAFLEFWGEIVAGETGRKLTRLIVETFGAGSEAHRVYLSARAQRPKAALAEVLAAGGAQPSHIALNRRINYDFTGERHGKGGTGRQEMAR